MTAKKFPVITNLQKMTEFQKLGKLREFLQKNPNYSSLEDLVLFTSLEKQEILRLQRLIQEEDEALKFPTQVQAREWKRLKSGKTKLIREAWTTEDEKSVKVWVDFDGEVKTIATFEISPGLMDIEVARRGAMNYLEIFWKDELSRIENLPLETHTIIRSLGSFSGGDIPVEPKKLPGLLDEIF